MKPILSEASYKIISAMSLPDIYRLYVELSPKIVEMYPHLKGADWYAAALALWQATRAPKSPAEN